jgi:amino acid permease
VQLTIKKFYEKIRISAYGLLATIAEWEIQESGTNAARKQRSYRLLVWRLGVACVLLLVAVGATYDWQQGSGHDSPVVNAIASITWLCYALVQIAFIVVAVIAVCRHFLASRTTARS